MPPQERTDGYSAAGFQVLADLLARYHTADAGCVLQGIADVTADTDTSPSAAASFNTDRTSSGMQSSADADSATSARSSLESD